MPRYVTGERINISNYKIPSLTTAVRHFVLFAKRNGRLPSTMPSVRKNILGRGPEGRILRKKTFIKLKKIYTDD